MKKEYTAPNMRVKEMAARKMLCGSNNSLGISSTSTTKQFSRDMDDFDEEEDW